MLRRQHFCGAVNCSRRCFASRRTKPKVTRQLNKPVAQKPISEVFPSTFDESTRVGYVLHAAAQLTGEYVNRVGSTANEKTRVRRNTHKGWRREIKDTTPVSILGRQFE